MSETINLWLMLGGMIMAMGGSLRSSYVPPTGMGYMCTALLGLDLMPVFRAFKVLACKYTSNKFIRYQAVANYRWKSACLSLNWPSP